MTHFSPHKTELAAPLPSDGSQAASGPVVQLLGEHRRHHRKWTRPDAGNVLSHCFWVTCLNIVLAVALTVFIVFIPLCGD